MSIILDALKKSESDQQRQSGPALFEVRVAPPKPRLPVWAIAIVVLLVINMLVVGYLLLRRSSRDDEAAATNTSTAAPPNGGPAPGQLYNQAPNGAPPVGAGARSTYGQAGYGPAGYGQVPNNGQASYGQGGYGHAPNNGQASFVQGGYEQPQPPSGQGRNNGQVSYGQADYGQANSGQIPNGPPPSGGPGSSYNTAPAAADTRMQGGRNTNEPTLANSARETGGAEAPANPDDYAPATEPESSSLFKGHVKRGTDSGLVLYQDAAATPGANIPELRLDLHVYAAKPQDRFALINMHKMHEGESLPNGVRVESITPDGVIMSHNGSRFLLPRE